MACPDVRRPFCNSSGVRLETTVTSCPSSSNPIPSCRPDWPAPTIRKLANVSAPFALRYRSPAAASICQYATARTGVPSVACPSCCNRATAGAFDTSNCMSAIDRPTPIADRLRRSSASNRRCATAIVRRRPHRTRTKAIPLSRPWPAPPAGCHRRLATVCAQRGSSSYWSRVPGRARAAACVTSACTDELPRRHPLRQFVTEVERLPVVYRHTDAGCSTPRAGRARPDLTRGRNRTATRGWRRSRWRFKAAATSTPSARCESRRRHDESANRQSQVAGSRQLPVPA
jgi:hypothetical protein